MVCQAKLESFLFLLAIFCCSDHFLVQEEKEYKGLSLVQFSLGIRELKLPMVQQKALNIYMRRFSLQ